MGDPIYSRPLQCVHTIRLAVLLLFEDVGRVGRFELRRELEKIERSWSKLEEVGAN